MSQPGEFISHFYFHKYIQVGATGNILLSNFSGEKSFYKESYWGHHCTIALNCHHCAHGWLVILSQIDEWKQINDNSHSKRKSSWRYQGIMVDNLKLTSKSRNVCRTHRVPTYPWYFPPPSSSSRPVSDYYYKCLIYRIQALGSPQPIHFLKAHDVSSPNTDENTNTKTKTVTKTMTKTKTPREWLKQ